MAATSRNPSRRTAYSMSNIFKFVAVLICISVPALAAGFIPIEDPDAFSSDILTKLSTKRLAEAATLLVDHMAQPNAAEPLSNALRIFDGKSFNFSSKVIDKEYNNALRQIIYYSYVKDLGFFYFRLNFKASSAGWILTSFTFKAETNELFPKDFTDR